MIQRSSRSVRLLATAFVLATVSTAGARAASPAPAAGTCVVVLDCGGVTQKTMPDADGKFVFRDVPAGSCTVSVVETAPPSAGAEASASVKRAEVSAPRDAASGMPTGKRQHAPIRYQVTVDAQPGAKQAAAAEDASTDSVHVTVAERRKEFTGHVTLMK